MGHRFDEWALCTTFPAQRIRCGTAAGTTVPRTGSRLRLNGGWRSSLLSLGASFPESPEEAGQ